MTLPVFWEDYGIFLMLVGAFVLALAINWVASRRSKSVFAVLWGLAPLLLLGAGQYVALQYVECETPGACEWVGLGYAVALLIIIAAGLVYLVLGLLMRFVVRRSIPRVSDPPTPFARDLRGAAFLLGAAGLGLLLAALVTLVFRSGVLVRWQRLSIPEQIEPRAGVPANQASLPPGVNEKAERIFLASSTTVYIQSDQGRVLGAHLHPNRVGGPAASVTWRVETGPPQAEARSYDRDCSPEMIVLPPPGRTVDRVRDRNCRKAEYYQTEYAILADGTLWRWRHYVPLYSFLAPAILAGPLAGFLVGVVLMIRSERIRYTA